MDKFGAPEVAIIFLLGVVPFVVWVAGNTNNVSDIPEWFRDELKRRIDKRKQK